MHPDVIGVRVVSGFTVDLEFADGFRAALDLEPWIRGRSGVFEPLQDPDYFRLIAVDPEAGTIVWPNEVDFCPDVLYEAAHGWITAPEPGGEIRLSSPAVHDGALRKSGQASP